MLGLDGVGVTDDFFDLGGASLDALEVVAAIDAEFGTDLHDAAVFRARTIRELADVVDRRVCPMVRRASHRPDRPDRRDAAPLSAGEEAMLFEYRMDPSRHPLQRHPALPRAIGDGHRRRSIDSSIRRSPMPCERS